VFDVFALSRRYRMAPLVVGTREQVGGAGFSLELAWDGHRVLAAAAGDRVRIVSADFRDWSDAFPKVALALRRLAARETVVEGFLCALDDRGRPSFDLLRHRAQTRGRALFAVWDVLHADGEDLRPLPLAERRARLAKLVAPCGEAVIVSTPLEGDVDALLEATRRNGVPGLFARPADAAYPAPDEPAFLAIASGETPLSWARSLSPPPVVTNEKKVMFPRDGLTKKEVSAYYEHVAAAMLPLLADRPIVAQRWPDGIDEFTWYQHRVPPRAPDYVRGVWIEGNHRIVLPTKDALLWMVNQAAITIHGWASRVGRLSEPDWVTLDLDPGERTRWEDVIEVAIAVRKALELLELPSVPKTSGQRGLHVLVPLAPGHTPLQAHDFARRLSMLVARLLPEKVTLEPEREKRAGRLYLDHLQNFVGKSLVLAYSLRAADLAPVSAPLAWSEVDASLDPKAFNLRTMRARLDAKGDLAAALTRPGVRLDQALKKLAG
jgi:DNA ligase D-like protein (predicted polymerase)